MFRSALSLTTESFAFPAAATPTASSGLFKSPNTNEISGILFSSLNLKIVSQMLQNVMLIDTFSEKLGIFSAVQVQLMSCTFDVANKRMLVREIAAPKGTSGPNGSAVELRSSQKSRKNRLPNVQQVV